MSDVTIYLGNKNYSSWSLRAWLVLVACEVPFEEVVIPLYRPDSKPVLLRHSPSGRVPALRWDDIVVWESLAIAEFLAEKCPDKGLWPADPAARAHARAISAEMHGGFFALRDEMSMDMRRPPAPLALSAAAQADVARLLAIWEDTRRRFGGDGPFLFGTFGIADAMYAPVASRFVSYAVDLPASARAYVDAIFALPQMQEWLEAGADEPWTIEFA